MVFNAFLSLALPTIKQSLDKEKLLSIDFDLKSRRKKDTCVPLSPTPLRGKANEYKLRLVIRSKPDSKI
jgi:hypothetical protein